MFVKGKKGSAAEGEVITKVQGTQSECAVLAELDLRQHTGNSMEQTSMYCISKLGRPKSSWISTYYLCTKRDKQNSVSYW